MNSNDFLLLSSADPCRNVLVSASANGYDDGNGSACDDLPLPNSSEWRCTENGSQKYMHRIVMFRIPCHKSRVRGGHGELPIVRLVPAGFRLKW